ncbi:hypothetical protein ACXM0N_07650 [Peribacillus simplex]|uniref:hypothetical protein n=1 Tax=Peribacillus sp. FSL E2-0159 TaxID=2975289 RepID=UPI00315B009C
MWYVRGLGGEGLWMRTDSALMRWVIYFHVMPTERYENVLQDKHSSGNENNNQIGK